MSNTYAKLLEVQDTLIPCVGGGRGSIGESIWEGPKTYSIRCMGENGPNCWQSPHLGSPEEVARVWNEAMVAMGKAGISFKFPPKRKGPSLY